jgi:proteasome lid subunit RPN8/RPN11
MVPARIELPTVLLAELTAAAQSAWPREFVAALGGELLADGWRLTSAEPLPNAAPAPARFTAEFTFEFTVEPWRFARAEAALRARGASWCGFVHSHPSGVALPSQQDRRSLWHHCVQLILASGPSIQAPVPHACFGDGRELLPVPIELLAAATAPAVAG